MDDWKVAISFHKRNGEPIYKGSSFCPVNGASWTCHIAAIPQISDSIVCDRPRRIIGRYWYSPVQVKLILEIGEGEPEG